MDFRILGPLEVLNEGRAITLGGSRQRALLALLLLHRNETLSTDRLIDELWGERPPTNAAKTVQVQISRLRKALAAEAGNGSAGVVVTRGRGYELRLDPDRLDAHCFERLVAEGRSELAGGHPRRAVSALEGALSLWRGQPLAELAYEPFAQREVARLDDLRVAALEQLIEAKLALGDHAEVVGQLEALIGEHPYRERLRAQLMLALYRSDRQADALQAYQDARRTLVDELGIDPSERLRELEQKILEQSPELASPAPEARMLRGPPPPPSATPEPAAFGWASRLRRAFTARGRVLIMVGALLLIAATLGALRESLRGEEALQSRPTVEYAASCSPVAYGGQGRPDFVVGAVAPLQGAFIDHGSQTSHALRMVLERRDWRAGNYTVGLQVCDELTSETGEPSAETCRRTAHALVRNRNVRAVVGPLLSDCSREMLAILNRAPGGPLPAISGSNTYLGLTRAGAGVAKGEPERHYPTGRRHYARLVPPDDAQSAALALYAKEHDARQTFVLDDDDAYGYGVAEAFRVAAERNGMLVVGRAQWNPEARAYRSLAARVRRAGADAVFLGGLAGNNGPRLIKDLRDALGPEAQILAPDGFSQPATLVDGAGEAADGIVIGTAVLPNRALPPEGRDFAKEFEHGFSAPPCCYTVHAAQALQIALAAIADSDGTRAQVLEELFETRVKNGLLGDFEIDRYGDTTQGAIGIYRIEGGHLRFKRTTTPPRELVGRR
jgi:DNA-binding SARP family transcriptional activator/ABC-type branched-subunit amino acid transport system substrate-binding protein